ncbi:MAG: hypothetical protein RLZZ618_4152 [Pseudomonadota bacterium]
MIARAAWGLVLALAVGLCSPAVVGAETVVDAARGPAPVLQTTTPPRLTNWSNDDQKRPRNYAMQPPTIPHRIDSYQVDRNFNKCLDCHALARTEFSQATPVSPTHYYNRDGKQLKSISTRRYFCLQCHVAQEPVQPIVGNSFSPAGSAVTVARPVPARKP